MIPKIVVTNPEGIEIPIKCKPIKRKYLYEDLIYLNTGYYHHVNYLDEKETCIII